MTWNRNEPFVREKPVVAFADGVETPHSIMLSNSRVNFNAKGKKLLPEGLFICRMGQEFHVLPRAVVTTGFTTGAATGAINLPQIFQPGDILTVIEGHRIVTISGSWTTSGSVQVTLPNGTTRNLNIGAGGSTAVPVATVAEMVANFLNTDPIASGQVFAVALAAVVYIYNKKGTAAPLLAVASSSNPSNVASTVQEPFATLGTILMVNVNGTITLSGNASIAAPIGSHIGVVVDEIYGVYPRALDLSHKPKFPIAPVAGAHGIYESSLPYLDGEIREKLPKLRIAEKF